MNANLICFFIPTRRLFAESTKKWLGEWRQIVFSDEKLFQTFANGRILVKRIRGESENPKYINFAIQQEKYRVNVWCCVTYDHKPILYLAGDNFDSKKYIEIIDDVIKNRFENFTDNLIFQQDNASIHTSNEVIKYFNQTGLSVLLWPPCSPDINIVEQVWSTIQKKLDRFLIKNKIKNRDHLFEIIKNLADQITINEVNRLFNSLPNRIKCVLANSGGFTRY